MPCEPGLHSGAGRAVVSQARVSQAIVSQAIFFQTIVFQEIVSMYRRRNSWFSGERLLKRTPMPNPEQWLRLGLGNGVWFLPAKGQFQTRPLA